MEQKKNPPKEFRAEYNAVKNHLHNTLGITKADIHLIIKETIQTEIQKVYNQAYLEYTIEKIIKEEIYGTAKARYWQKDGFKQHIAKKLTDQLIDTVANQLSIDVQIRSNKN